jgi:cytochrome b561
MPKFGDRYSSFAIFLHWTMALGIFALITIGLTMKHATLTPMRLFQLYQMHKSIGVVILLAAMLRLGWRLLRPPPPLPASMPPMEQKAARGGHLLLYFFLFALPLTGWALVSTSKLNIPTVLFGMVPWPHLPVLSTLADKAPAEAFFKLVHRLGAWTLIVVIFGHAAAALRHHFLIHDDVLLRMLPRVHSADAKKSLPND